MKGFLYCTRAQYLTAEGNRGRFSEHFNCFREKEELFQTAQWFSRTGEQNESMIFQSFPRLTPVAPISCFYHSLSKSIFYFSEI